MKKKKNRGVKLGSAFSNLLKTRYKTKIKKSKKLYSRKRKKMDLSWE